MLGLLIIRLAVNMPQVDTRRGFRLAREVIIYRQYGITRAEAKRVIGLFVEQNAQLNNARNAMRASWQPESESLDVVSNGVKARD